MLLSDISLPALLRAPRLLKVAAHRKSLQVAAISAHISPRPQFSEDMQVDNPLATQAFASNKLNRSAGDKRDPAFTSIALRTPSLLFVNGAEVCVRHAESKTALFWATQGDLQSLGVGISQDQVTSAGEEDPDYNLLPASA